MFMRKTCKIVPKLSFYEIESYLKRHGSLSTFVIEDGRVYDLVRNLTRTTPSSSKDEYDERWEDFYLPLRRSGREISIPFTIVLYRDNFFCVFFRLGTLEIRKGDRKTQDIYSGIFREALRFQRMIERTAGAIVKKTVPYDFRTGRITGKYVLSRMMSQKEKEKRLNNYRQHLQKELTVRGCSLKEYLGTAALCYRKAFRKGAAKLTPRQMHDEWAEKRVGGMLFIKYPDSRRAFSRWYNRNGWTGAHPFEIVFR